MTLFVQIRADNVNHIVRHAVVDQVKADFGGKLILGVFEHVERFLHVAVEQRQNVGIQRLLERVKTVGKLGCAIAQLHCAVGELRAAGVQSSRSLRRLTDAIRVAAQPGYKRMDGIQLRFEGIERIITGSSSCF